MSLAVTRLAPHLSSDALDAVRAMEREGLVEVRVQQQCPECFGLDGVHNPDHDEVEPTSIATFVVDPEAVPGWIARVLASADIGLVLDGKPVVLSRAVEQDARILAPLSANRAGERPVRLRIAFGGNEAPLQMQPGREYLRLRFGAAVALDVDRRVIDVDAMHLLGSTEERRAFRERLRRRLHGLLSTPLVPTGAELGPLDENQLVVALGRALMPTGRYEERMDRDSWRALASDWGLSPEDGRAMYRGSASLLTCMCANDVRPHVHGFLADGQSADALGLEPVLVRFCAHQTERVHALLEWRATLRHLRDIGVGLKAFSGAIVGAGLKLADAVAPGHLPLPIPTDLAALAVTFGVAGIVLIQPIVRLVRSGWQLRSGNWDLPRSG
jgi:hypothetical protein